MFCSGVVSRLVFNTIVNLITPKGGEIHGPIQALDMFYTGFLNLITYIFDDFHRIMNG